MDSSVSLQNQRIGHIKAVQPVLAGSQEPIQFNQRTSDILKTLFFASVGGIALSGVLYGAGALVGGIGTLLANQTVIPLPLWIFSPPLIVIGKGLGGTGALLFAAITKPIWFVAVDTPLWVVRTALPCLKASAKVVASKISETITPCFTWLGGAGVAIGKVFDWLVHQVFADGVKIIDKFITDIWKSVATGLVYFVTNLVFPSAKSLFSWVGNISNLTQSVSEWLANKVSQVYRNVVNHLLKPMWTAAADAVKGVFGRVFGTPTEVTSKALGSADGFPSRLVEMLAKQDRLSIGEFLAQQHQILASLTR